MIIPDKPERGMVISYSFLWKHEQARGETSGRKDRPVAIVVIRTDVGPGEPVYVIPITHSKPLGSDPSKISIPQSIKQMLGLDDQPSWVDVSEYDVLYVRDQTSVQPIHPTIGEVPRLAFMVFTKITEAMNAYRISHKPRLSLR